MEDEVQVEEVQEVEQPAPKSLEEVMSELEQTRQELGKWQTEAKAHQKTASKKDAEAKRWQNEITTLRDEFKTQFELVAEMLEEQRAAPEYGEEPKQRKSYKEERAKRMGDPVAREATQVANEIKAIEKELGIEFDKSKESREAYLKWMEGVNYNNPSKFREALDLMKEVKETMTEAKSKETEEERINRLVEEKLQERLKAERKKRIDNGELDAETGKPKGAAVDDKSWLDDWNAGRVPVTKDTIEKMRRITGG